MKGFDVLKVKSAVKTHNKFDLSKSHLTTMNFGEIVPLYVEETIPGDKFSIDSTYFSRMAPLVHPTYGKFEFKTVSAFVPYHQIAVDSDAWFAGKTTWEGATPVQRTITMSTLAEYISTYCTTTTGATANNTEYTEINSGGTTVYKIFTTKGKYFTKILNALGYTIPQKVNWQTGSDWMSIRNTKLSAYPLLAFFKLYNDYMSQSQRFNSSVLSDTLRKIKYNIAISGIYATTGDLTAAGIDSLFDWLFLNYENDYFTSAWQQPNNAINSIENIASSNVPGHTNVVMDNTTDNYVNVPTVSNVTAIGQRMLDFLKSFDDWVRRNNYSGSRSVQQIYSRFGIKTDDYKSHYAQVITTDTLPIQIGDITSTADTSTNGGLELGAYSGKGIMSGSKNINCNVSDYGVILILGYFTVTPMNSFGYDRRVLRNSPLDYYNPEFDGIGADAISVGEVWTSPIDQTGNANDTSVFGFTERYNAYRYGRDVITGDFRDYRWTPDMAGWHSGRNLATLRSTGNLVAQSTSMNTLPQENSEYNRIFNNTISSKGHFYLTCKFNVSAIRPMLSLNQVPKLGEGDTAVPRNGNVIS